MATVRAAGIRGFAGVVRGLGADPAPLVRAAGLDTAVLDHDDVPIADWRLAALLQHSAERLDCPDLGLRMAARHDLDTLGPLAALLANCRTGADALAATERYLAVHSDALRVDRIPDPDGRPGVTALRYRQTRAGLRPVQATDAGIGFLHRAMRRLFGGDYGLIDVRLDYRPTADPGAYLRFFGAPVRFGAPESLLRVPDELLTRPVDGAREELRDRAESYLRIILPGADDMIGRIRAVVGESLDFGPVPIEILSNRLALHPRTLQRRLAQLGTTYAGIVDDVRRDRARLYLTGTRLPFHHVSARLGFAEQATFSRACHRWWGVPPRRVRAPGSRIVGLSQVSGG
ncbi:AraC family transcriptional regulator [Actinoplanes lobatus]|nr:AraC family transcriptional regulator [Actinoplanes lobatus]MBB4753800.1 AraC-like DNA-binding protein [Actinoplanes lobatus]